MNTGTDSGRYAPTEGPSTGILPAHHLVVGFDRYPSSWQALRFAITLAEPLNAYLHVAHIVDLDDVPIDPDGDDWEDRVTDAAGPGTRPGMRPPQRVARELDVFRTPWRPDPLADRSGRHP